MRTKLLSEQEMEDLIEFREHIIARAISTERCDRQKAEEALRKIYEFLEMVMPEEIIWVDSPYQMCTLGDREQRSVGLLDKPWRKFWARFRGEPAYQLWEQILDRVWHKIADPIRWELSDQLGEQLQYTLAVRLGDRLDQSDMQCYPWLLFSYALEGTQVDSELSQLSQLAYELGEHAFWILPYEDKIIFCDRPTRLYCNERERLHSLDGMPAIEFADGWQVYAWDGVRVDKKILNVPPSREDLMTTNLEIRRILWERWGTNYCVKQLNLEKLSSDEWGELWQGDTGDDELAKFVKVINSTPEPDGHFKDYWLRVPPDIITAKAGIAWTFGLESEQYIPSIMT